MGLLVYMELHNHAIILAQILEIDRLSHLIVILDLGDELDLMGYTLYYPLDPHSRIIVQVFSICCAVLVCMCWCAFGCDNVSISAQHLDIFFTQCFLDYDSFKPIIVNSLQLVCDIKLIRPMVALL